MIVGLLFAPALAMTTADPDLWGHLRYGLDALATRSLPSVDPYSFTQDVPWVNHEWLSEVCMAIAYRFSGTIGLSVLKAALVASLFAVVLQAYGRTVPIATALAILLLAIGTGRQTVTLRPQLWTLLNLAVLCRLFISGPRRWWLAAVPALFMVWVNLHGGWIVGAALLAVWTTAQMWRPQRSRSFAAAVALFSAAATLINPYGWGMWEFLAGTVRLGRSITEWQPLFTVPILATIPWVCVVAATALLAVTRPRLPIERVAMIMLLGCGALRVERLAPLCVTAAVVLLSPTVLQRWGRARASFDPLSKNEAAGLMSAMFVLVIVSTFATVKTASCIPISGTWTPDRTAGRALAATSTSGRIVTYFDWGEYAIWHLAPRLRVSIDGRRETIYSDAALARHFALEAGTADGLRYLQRLDPIYVWLPIRFTAVRDWVALHGYRVDLQTDTSFVAVRADQPQVPVFTEPVAGCFPGP